MSHCPECLRALQRHDHRNYIDGCVGCGVRELAQMPQEKREQALDVLLKKCGASAHARVNADLRVEMARIAKLRGERVKEKA